MQLVEDKKLHDSSEHHSQPKVNQKQQAQAAALGKRRELGAYYTPEDLSDILSEWAIKDRSDLILEPSFGGCGFLKSAIKTITSLCPNANPTNIYGCDIDKAAFEYLNALENASDIVSNFVEGDYLDVGSPPGWPNQFDVIFGNPPYIPYQRIPSEQRVSLRKIPTAAGRLGGRAGLWAYFVAHSFSRLAIGGRMAWVLPGAFLHVDYAEALRKHLGEFFERSAAFVIHDRLFLGEGTDEETVILLADGYRLLAKGGGSISLGQVASLVELKNSIRSWDAGTWTGSRSNERVATLAMSEDEVKLFSLARDSGICKPLGKFSRVQIGVVTGANDFFVKNLSSLKAGGMSAKDCDPVISKFKCLTGLSFSEKDHEIAAQRDERVFLVNGASRELNPRVQDYLSKFPKDRRESTSTFKKRASWSSTSDSNYPDAYFPVMHHYGPRLVLSDFGCNSTNTIHRVYFDGLDDNERKLIALSVLSSFSQVSAELVGRRYGSGVLKHEPREAEKIELLIPNHIEGNLDEVFSTVDTLLRGSQRDAATEAVDDFIYAHLPEVDAAAFGTEMRRILERIRQRRRPQKSRSREKVDEQ